VHRRDGSLILSPSDLNNFLECEHLSRLDLAVAHGELTRPVADNPQAQLIRRKGEEHEKAYLASLRGVGKDVFLVDHGDSSPDAAAATQEAMRRGAEVIYQAMFVDDGWLGYADFVERVERPSALGSFSYEVADTKLARTTKPHFLLQLCFYTEQVGRIQGVLPERMHVVLGTNERASFRVRDFDAYYRRVQRRFLAWLDEQPETYPHPVEHCPVCTWNAICTQKWIDDDHLSLVAHMRRAWTAKLGEAGITTLAALALAPADADVSLRQDILGRLREQAELQYRHRLSGEHEYRLLPPAPGRGLALLPRPSEGDVFFDMEGDPFFEGGRGLEYLFGVVSLEDGEPRFQAFWAHDRIEEKRAFEQLVDFLIRRLERYPDMHVYHYAHYEPSAVRRLMGEHATREDEVDHLLRREVFVDLYRVVEQSVRISQPRYGLKQVEAFYLPPRQEEVSAGEDSILMFEEWLQTGDATLLEAIERYNEVDCRSTTGLRDWLLGRRTEAGVTVWREPPPVRELSEEAAEAVEERERLKESLLDGAKEDDARWLAAHLLEYHRREDKPVWWAYFRRRELSPTELVDDSEAIGDLSPADVPAESLKRSLVHTLTFSPQQHKLEPGEVVDPETERAEEIIEIDDERGFVRLRRGPSRKDDPLPRALIPGGPWDTRYQRSALRRVGQTIVAGHAWYRALQDLLARERPRVRGLEPGMPLQAGSADLEEAKRLVSRLDASHLFIQGPPGSGKTWTGARLIVRLLRQRMRVGVAAPSHKAIHNLLAEIERAAIAEGVRFRGLKKCGAGEETVYKGGGLIRNARQLANFIDPGVHVLAGTAWLFAREELDSTLDYLFVDEAGQVSLADAVAMGTAARNLVLLGDPLQLAQVSQGTHPGGSGRSVLEHLLGTEPTIPLDRGLFLDLTWRMHPDICGFVSEIVYDGRLKPAPCRERQSLEAIGAGIRYVPVEHEARSQASPEEAGRIRAEIERLEGRRYTDADGQTRPLGHADILVVAPYNAQVRTLRAALPDTVRVGTVDKFQGQEAPIVFYSTASSSGADLPRHLEFLFSRNRLNVAISRAQCLAIVVGSPRLLDIRCRTVEQMRMVNALCRLVETAEQQTRVT
jgi:predicted RecB family nuclease